MKRASVLLAAAAMALGSAGCSTNHLVGTWQVDDGSDGGAGCRSPLTFTSDAADGSPVTYKVDGNVVYVSGTAITAGMRLDATPYNMTDNDHMVYRYLFGGRYNTCNYTRVK